MSGLCFFFIPPEYRVSLSMFFFVRALEIVRHIRGRARLPANSLPQSDALLMASASGIVVWCWLFHRSALEPAYAHFLDIQGGKPRWVTDAYTQCHFGNDALFASHPIIDIAQQRRVKQGLAAHSLQRRNTLRCDILHPGQGHAAHMLSLSCDRALLRALPVYIPVYVLPLLVFRMRDILRSVPLARSTSLPTPCSALVSVPRLVRHCLLGVRLPADQLSALHHVVQCAGGRLAVWRDCCDREEESSYRARPVCVGSGRALLPSAACTIGVTCPACVMRTPRCS